jgi:hypothetical protein
MSILAITKQIHSSITKQRYNQLFHWDLTLLSLSNGIRADCLVCFEKTGPNLQSVKKMSYFDIDFQNRSSSTIAPYN